MADDDKIRSQTQEDVARLYLRLNGFFVTGFISHSPVYGRVLTEIDALGIRMPHNAEPERGIGTDALLQLSNKYTELVICEVKSRGEQLRFNKALAEDTKACASVLRWAGLFSERELPEIITGLQASLQRAPLRFDEPPTFLGPRNTRVRCLLFSLEKQDRRPSQPWFISGPDAFSYIFDCLCPSQLRPACSTQYDFNQWREFTAIVKYFKSRLHKDAGDIQQLYETLGKPKKKPARAT
jgi:hypothetical protein